MTEAEWLACDDAERMRDLLWKVGISPRKHRLSASAFCRLLWPHLIDPRCWEAISVAERYADGQATPGELRAAAEAAHPDRVEKGAETYHGPEWSAFYVAAPLIVPSNEDDPAVASVLPAVVQSGWVLEGGASPSLCPLLRCIFGMQPFRSGLRIALERTEPSISLAQAAYEERSLPSGHLDNAHLAVLSDALEEAGCTDGDILAHLRSPGPHVRGCWALDLILGKG